MSSPGLFEAHCNMRTRQLHVRLATYHNRCEQERDRLIGLLDAVISRCSSTVIAFDLNGETRISSGTVGLFLRYRKNGCDVELVHTSDHVIEMLRRLNLDRVFAFSDS